MKGKSEEVTSSHEPVETRRLGLPPQHLVVVCECARRSTFHALTDTSGSAAVSHWTAVIRILVHTLNSISRMR